MRPMQKLRTRRPHTKRTLLPLSPVMFSFVCRNSRYLVLLKDFDGLVFFFTKGGPMGTFGGKGGNKKRN
jgi:hypothetical protein